MSPCSKLGQPLYITYIGSTTGQVITHSSFIAECITAHMCRSHLEMLVNVVDFWRAGFQHVGDGWLLEFYLPQGQRKFFNLENNG